MKIFGSRKVVTQLSGESMSQVRGLIGKMNQEKCYTASTTGMAVRNYFDSLHVPLGDQVTFRIDAETGKVTPPIPKKHFKMFTNIIDTINSGYDTAVVKKESIPKSDFKIPKPETSIEEVEEFSMLDRYFMYA